MCIIVIVVYRQISFGPVYLLTRRTWKRLGMKRILKLVWSQCVQKKNEYKKRKAFQVDKFLYLLTSLPKVNQFHYTKFHALCSILRLTSQYLCGGVQFSDLPACIELWLLQLNVAHGNQLKESVRTSQTVWKWEIDRFGVQSHLRIENQTFILRKSNGWSLVKDQWQKTAAKSSNRLSFRYWSVKHIRNTAQRKPNTFYPSQPTGANNYC